jgi:AhpD family alkylhydroperoxidase
MTLAGPLIGDDEASPEVCALYGDIRATRGVDLISNFWRALANDPPTLRRMWDSFNSTMAPGAIDPLTKELLFLAVSATNGCAYCTALHGTAAKTQGMSSEMLDELMAVVGLANEATRLAAVYRIPVDDRYEALLDELAKLREIDRRRAAAERAQKNLSRYFAPKLAAMLAGRDEALGAVGRQTVAVLFVDIVGFTAMSETMPPESVVTMLRQYHAQMTAAIVACEGTVEKYIGDEIFAVFGVPTQGDRDAENALRCAELMLQALDRWNDERGGRKEPPLRIGIGLHYGPVVVGDVGSAHGMSFTLIGDTVNIASRLQGLTRDLGTPLVVGDPLVRAIAAQGDAAAQLRRLQERGEHALRGRSELVRIWTRAGSDSRLAAADKREQRRGP